MRIKGKMLTACAATSGFILKLTATLILGASQIFRGWKMWPCSQPSSLRSGFLAKYVFQLLMVMYKR